MNGPRLFGLENEPPDDLHNIFYRCVRYCTFSGRKRTMVPSVKFFVALVRDELKLKYATIVYYQTMPNMQQSNAKYAADNAKYAA